MAFINKQSKHIRLCVIWGEIVSIVGRTIESWRFQGAALQPVDGGSGVCDESEQQEQVLERWFMSVLCRTPQPHRFY